MYKLFSQRKREAMGDIPDVYEYDTFSVEFRNQFFHIVSELFEEINRKSYSGYGERFDIWKVACEMYAREKGLKKLLSKYGYSNNDDAYEYYVDQSKDVDFLDLLDFTVTRIFYHDATRNFVSEEAIESATIELNYRFRQHSLGYEFVNGVLITRTDEHIHSNIVKPALILLHRKEFRGAEDEFLTAWKYYKDGKFKDAILNAGKAFESVMKSICKQLKFSFDEQKDDAKKLIQILRENSFFPAYLESHMNGIRATLESGAPTVRNKTSGHGQGEKVVEVSETYASYTLNLVATNILFLCKLFDERRK